jgi:ribonuclease P protein component
VKKEGLAKSIRLKKGSEFKRIMQDGAKKKSENLIVFRLQGDEDTGQKFGIRIPRGIKRAVDRNRIKRAIREVLRKNKGKFAKNESVVVLCKASARRANPDKLKEDLDSLIR